jgi:uncharacterized protein (DUF362 family)
MMNRRKFLLGLSGALLQLLALGCLARDERKPVEKPALREVKSEVYVVKTEKRSDVGALLENFDLSLRNKRVALKANYNSADPFPATTHLDTLREIVEYVRKKGAANIVLAERSGMGDTREVLEEMGVFELSRKLGFDVVVLDELGEEGWIRIPPEGTHWRRGFLFARVFRESDAVIQTCCLKTHRFGGHFTMSLKNSVGMVAKYDPADGYNYMRELHRSRYQRVLIAEINVAYAPEVVVMDALQGFSTGGPDVGTLIEPGLLLASRDRAALDAVGVALLRLHGTTREVQEGRIFEQEQLARAAELGLGVSRTGDIEVVAVNREAEDTCWEIRRVLRG